MPLHSALTGADLHAPGAHKTQHEDGGSDEISLTGLTGAPLLTSATTAVTQSPGDNSTKVATTAYADAAAAGGVSDGDKGDITVSSSGTVWNIDAGVVTGTEIANDVALAGNPTTTTQSSGNSTTRIATTAFVADAVAKQPEVLIIAVSDETTALTTGAPKVTFRMPFAMTLTGVRASVTTAPTGAKLQVDINETGSGTILSTKLTIDATEKTSTTATPAVISDSSLADDAEITIDIDVVGSSVAGAGLKVYLIGTRT
jgi:hypothetical protein